LKDKKVIIIGSGIGGLAAAMRLSTCGINVQIFEKQSYPGGKIRTKNSVAGLIDSGPTVLTMHKIFEELFRACGEHIEDHLELVPEEVLARHWWRDGSSLDLFSSFEKNMASIKDFSGIKSAKEFEKFNSLAEKLFTLFNQPIIKSPKPKVLPILIKGITNGKILYKTLLRQRILYDLLEDNFSDPRLIQLFARYATYVGGSPFMSPSILSLIWNVESKGVWRIKGGMHQIPKSMERIAQKAGAVFNYGQSVDKILIENKKVKGIKLENGDEVFADIVLFNGDPRALTMGLLGSQVKESITQRKIHPRSLSAYVWSFAAKPINHKLVHHNVFFNINYKKEFQDINDGVIPTDPTLYVCAQGNNKDPTPSSNDIGRFEIIINAAPISNLKNPDKHEEFQRCKNITFPILESMGLKLELSPKKEMLTTPFEFEKLFPGSSGSLYGRSPHGINSTFKKPLSQSQIKGLLVAGGGTHPGAGVPMACQSGKHAAETILRDLNLMS